MSSEGRGERERVFVLQEYEALCQLEQETTQMRHNTFTALISISFVLTGLAFRNETSSVVQIPLAGTITSSQLAAAFGFMFYCFTVVHYAWYHRYSHRYRDRLKQLEVELDFRVYRNRKRPTLRNAKFHFDWTLYIMGVIYFFAVLSFAGWRPIMLLVVSGCGMYALLLLWSIRWDNEPLEDHGGLN